MELPAKLQTDNPLWHFALAFWQLEDARQACLALQDQGWSVTRLLCAGWLALEGRRYNGQEDAKLTKWRQEVTGVLRSIRRSLPKDRQATGKLRTLVARLELQAERTELALAWHALSSVPKEYDTMQGRRLLIAHNLNRAASRPGQTRAAAALLEQLAGLLAGFSRGGQRS